MPNFPEIFPELEQILVRFFDALDCVDGAFLDNYTFDNLARPGKLVSKPVAGTDLSRQHLRSVLKTVIGHADSPSGIKTSNLVTKVRELLRFSPPDYKRHHDTYDLKKLRGREWVLAFARCIPSRPGTMCEVNKPPIAESVYPHSLPDPQHRAVYTHLFKDICPQQSNLNSLIRGGRIPFGKVRTRNKLREQAADLFRAGIWMALFQAAFGRGFYNIV